MTRIQLGLRSVRRLFRPAALIVCGVTSVSAQTAAPVCTAVTSWNNTLYLVPQAGSPVVRLATDALPKLSVTIAPGGNKVAYIPSANPHAFTIVDTGGQSATTVLAASPTAVFTEVSWDAQNVLKTQNHVGQTTNNFSFYSIPGAATAPSQGATNAATGQICAAPPGNNSTACIVGNTVVVGANVVYSENVFAPGSSTVVASLSIPVGGAATSSGTPSFQLQVLSIVGGVTLQVTLPTGNWIQSRVASGTVIPLNLDDVLYGFVPTVTDPVKGSVQVQVLQSAFGTSVFDPVISWRDGDHVAVVDRKPTGPQLMLLNKNGNASPPIAGPFNVQEPLVGFTFNTPSLIVFQTIQRFGVVPLTITTSGSGPAIALGAITDLPTSISASLPTGITTVPVLAWSCQ